MKRVELTLIAGSLMGIALNLANLPSGVSLSVLATGSLAFFYLYFSFALFNNIRFRNLFKKSSYSGIKALRIMGSVVTGFVLTLLVVGIIFKTLMWPGASLMCIAALPPTLLVSIVTLVRYLPHRDGFYEPILWRLVIYSSIVVGLLNLPPYSLWKIKYRDHPAYIQAYKDMKEHPGDTAYENAMLRERAKTK
ncbi:MAG: hypothetical protein U0T73_08030 [Chitinophagales bacterium]